MTQAARQTTTFILREAKKHSVRYDADPTAIVVIAESIYISKDVLKSPWPQSIVLTLEIAESALSR